MILIELYGQEGWSRRKTSEVGQVQKYPFLLIYVICVCIMLYKNTPKYTVSMDCAIYSVSNPSSSVVCVSFLISDSVWLSFPSYTLMNTHLIRAQQVFQEHWGQTQNRPRPRRSVFEKSTNRCSPWCDSHISSGGVVCCNFIFELF